MVPLTGDASDRRYFRVLLKDAKPIVLALHQGPIDFDSMPFVAVARLLAEVPLPVPRILHHSNELGILGLEDLGDVTLQAHLGAATAGEHAALYRQAVTLIARMQQRGEALRSEKYPPYRIAFDVEKLTWELEFFVKHYLMAYKGFDPSDAGARHPAARVGGDRRGARRRATRAVPSRLSQPQPDAARRPALHD